MIGVKQPPRGVYDDIPEREYHSWQLASASALKILAEQTPRHLQHARAFPDDENTPAKVLGRAVHCLVLEPHTFEDKFAIAPDGIDRRTKEGKETWAAFSASAAGRDVLNAEVGARAKEIAAAVKLHPGAAKLLAIAARRELSVVSELDGVRSKARADAYGTLKDGSGLVVDLKVKSGSAAPRAFQRMLADFNYPLGACFYRRVLEGEKVRADSFAYIVVENEPPYGVATYSLAEESIHQEWARVERLLALYARCERENSWPGYSEKLEPIAAPAWMSAFIAEEVAA